jgi:cytochrome P450
MVRALTASDAARLAWHLGVPLLLGGVVAPTPRFTPYLVRRQATARTFAFLQRIRLEYGPRFWIWLPPAWTLVVLDADGIAELLASDANFADPPAKTILLSGVTPQGVIVSHGDAWRHRRMLNDDVLAFGQPLHPGSEEFLDIVEDEVERLLEHCPDVIAWRDFSELADRVAQQVIFGRGRFEPAVATRMAHVASSSNWAIRRPSALRFLFRYFQDEMARLPIGQESGAPLAQRCGHWLGEHEGSRKIADAPSQMAFWLFVIKDASELHFSRTLALIASAPQALANRIRAQLHRDRPITPGIIHAATLLEACIKEELRLWTAVPLLLRRAVRDCRLDDTPIRAGQQMLMHVGFYHRDPQVFGASADRFDPEARSRDDNSDERSATNSNPPLYVFSRHRQACAGQFLAMLLLKAMLACLLRRVDVTLLAPTLPLAQIPLAMDAFHLRFKVRALDA